MEIEVGEYIRTKSGYIFKVIETQPAMSDETGSCPPAVKGKKYNFAFIDNIVKHSKNIIDLIEVEDYVNGYLVLDIAEDLSTGELHLEMQSNCPTPDCNCQLYNKDIKSIVTKEQFESIKYNVEV